MFKNTQNAPKFLKGQDIVKRVTSFIKPTDDVSLNIDYKKRKLIVKTE